MSSLEVSGISRTNDLRCRGCEYLDLPSLGEYRKDGGEHPRKCSYDTQPCQGLGDKEENKNGCRRNHSCQGDADDIGYGRDS